MAEFKHPSQHVSEYNFDDDIRAQLRTLQLHPTREAEIAEELAQHADDRMRELKSRGYADLDAREIVLKELREGNLASALVGVENNTIQPAIELGSKSNASWTDTLTQDIRFAIR